MPIIQVTVHATKKLLYYSKEVFEPLNPFGHLNMYFYYPMKCNQKLTYLIFILLKIRYTQVKALYKLFQHLGC